MKMDDTLLSCRKKKIKMFLLISVFSIFIFFLIPEIILRVFKPDLRYYYNARGITGGISFKLNSLGMREVEFPLEKPVDEYRRLCAGDSTTFGMSEKFEDTWPKQLEKKLIKHSDNIFVINAGIRGIHPHIQLKLCKGQYNKIKFDLFILGFSMNDVRKKTFLLDQEEYLKTENMNFWQKIKISSSKLRYSLNRFYTIAFLQLIMKSIDTTHNSQFIISRSPEGFNAFGITKGYDKAWNDTLESLMDLKYYLKNKNIKFFIVPIPFRFMISDDPRDNKLKFEKDKFLINPINKLRNFCRMNDIVFVESLSALQIHRRDMLNGRTEYDPFYIDITDDYCHPNSFGYGVIADTVCSSILPSVLEELRK